MARMEPRNPDEWWWWRVPGDLGTAAVAMATALWVYWSSAEFYFEAWGLPLGEMLLYLIPGAVCLALALLVTLAPKVGGWTLIAIGGAFSVWWTRLQMARSGRSLLEVAAGNFLFSGILVVAGALFLFEARRRRLLREAGRWPRPSRWRRRARLLVAIMPPIAVALGISASELPRVLTRHDDGDRGARLIEGDGVRLVWAPAGPGWNWKQPWGGYPSWDSLALYGAEPIGIDGRPKLEAQGRPHASAGDMHATGLCRYLSVDGTTLADTPQDIWRLPTAEELTRSLVRDGVTAGCVWDGTPSGRVECARKPDKESPLWNPDQPPIYMWAADEIDADRALYVSHNAWVHPQPKSWGNPRHGYRCVRDPDPDPDPGSDPEPDPEP